MESSLIKLYIRFCLIKVKVCNPQLKETRPKIVNGLSLVCTQRTINVSDAKFTSVVDLSGTILRFRYNTCE